MHKAMHPCTSAPLAKRAIGQSEAAGVVGSTTSEVTYQVIIRKKRKRKVLSQCQKSFSGENCFPDQHQQNLPRPPYHRFTDSKPPWAAAVRNLGYVLNCLSYLIKSCYRAFSDCYQGGRKGGGNRGGGGGGNGGDRDASWRNYPDVVKKNEKLERYYNEAIPLDDAEREEFWSTLKRELPNSFRFCGSKGHALAVKRLLETRYAPEIVRIERYDGQPVQAPQAVSWYPDGLAYSMNTPKQVIRKFPPFAAFQKFLVSETTVGNISRQEIVSMIPPLLMDIRPGMNVLDMCAAPGSKAAQLLEMVHTGEEARIRKFMDKFGHSGADQIAQVEGDAELSEDIGDDGRATGLLVANDADYKRSHMLVHQLKRLSSPNLIVTNHDATLYPSLKLPRNPQTPDKGNYLKFDRILADVPCSGDGTLRKNVNLWKDWQPGNALGLHQTQTRILVRALQLLKPGGRVVYSTCSMNPVENESVVVSAIERCGGPSKVDIIDCSDRLTGLKRVPGMHQWKIMDKSARIWNSWEEVEQHALLNAEGQIPGKLSYTMFPRPDTNECSSLPLDRCMRVYAHQQDTGGFFITVLEKKGDIKAKPEVKPEQSVKVEGGADTTMAAGGQQEEVVAPAGAEAEEEKAAVGEPTDVLPATGGAKRPREETQEEAELEAKRVKTEEPEDAPSAAPAVPADAAKTEDAEKTEDADDATKAPNKSAAEPQGTRGPNGAYEEPFKYLPAEHSTIKDVESFYNISPRFPSDRYMVRNMMGEPAKAIYYTSALVRDILTENEGRGVKFVNAGVKMYMKQEAPSAEVCRWRIQSDGMPIIAGYVGPERKITLTRKDTFRVLLKEMFAKFVDDDWARLNEMGEKARSIGMGCCLLSIEPDGSDPDFAERMVLPLWKSFHSLNLMLPKEDRAAMLLRIFNDTEPVVNRTLKETKKLEAEKEGGGAKAEESAPAPAAEEGAKVEAAADGEAAKEDTEMKDGDAEGTTTAEAKQEEAEAK